MNIVKSKQVKKYIDSQDKPTRTRLLSALEDLPEGDVVPIIGLENTYRLRVGNFRAIFIKETDIIKVTVLNSRGEIYKRRDKL